MKMKEDEDGKWWFILGKRMWDESEMFGWWWERLLVDKGKERERGKEKVREDNQKELVILRKRR